MATLQEYKCPCCGGAIAFDSTIQKMKCPYCDTEFEMDALKGYDDELQKEQTDSMSGKPMPVENGRKAKPKDYIPMYASLVEERLWEMPIWQRPLVHSVAIRSS